jgi:hypothetical protein
LLGDVPVKLLINGQQKAVLSVDVSAFDQSIMAFKFRLDSAGFYAASIQVEDYPVVYDDQFYFALHLQQSIDVLVVSSEYANLDVLTYLQSDTMFSVEGIKESSIDYSTFSNYQTIVLNALTDFSSGLLIELEKYVKAGGNILFFPKSNQDLEVLNRFCQAMDMSLISNLDTSLVKISEIDLESAEFNGIFDIENQRNKLSDNANLPYFKQTYLPLKKEVNSVSLIQNEAGMTVLLRHQLENGKVYFMLSPVEATQSNFTTHAVFVPVVFNLILQNGFPASLYSNLGRESEVKVSFNSDAMDAKIEMQNMIDTASFIPQYRIQHANIYLSFQQQPSTAGVFQVKNQNQEIARLGFNFDRKESYLNYINYKELNGIVADRQLESVKVFETYNKSISQQIEQVQQGFQLWKLFVLLALLLLIIELFLLRFSKY